jgi:hypothetical protein
MKLRILTATLLLAGVCSAREHDYQQGVLISRDSSACLTPQPSASTTTAVLVGDDGLPKQARGFLCQEYILQSDHMTFRIRPRDEKHPVVLPVGEIAQFRVGKGELLLRVPEISDKEHAYVVVSITPRQDTTSAAILQKQAATQTASKN